jgi:D-alanyl-D-alanine carboxypeptidase
MILPLLLCLGGLSKAAPPQNTVAICTQHLMEIGRALAAYERDHREYPPLLSDLYPRYITDKGLFLCPADPSSGPQGTGLATDPRMPASYLYAWSTDKAPELGPAFKLGPQPPGADATWRDCMKAARRHFGDYVPLVACVHHEAPEGPMRVLAVSGRVYRSGSNWDLDPGTIEAGLQRMEQDLAGDRTHFTRIWALSDVDEYASQWVNTSLPPEVRFQLSSVADHLSARMGTLSGVYRRDAGRLAARFYQGAGQTERAIAAAEAAGEPEVAAFLKAARRYQADPARVKPPVDEYIRAEMAQQHIPGMTVAVVRGGKLVLAKGYGLIDLERAVPATKDTVYNLASIGKVFTATGIMMLVEAGKLSLDDRILRHLPQVPSAWKDVTIRHLLTHTSGIPDATVGGTTEEIIRHAADAPLDFTPGERWSYSNAGFSVLGRIIEQVSGKPLDLFLDERIYQPLHMDWTARGRGFEDLKIVSKGFQWEAGQLKAIRTGNAPDPRWLDRPSTHGFYPACSTVMDLVKFDAALYTEKLLRKTTLEQMWTPAKLNSGQVLEDQGLGWWLGKYRGQKLIFHGGASLGIEGMFWRLPETRSAVVLLAPLYGVRVGEMATRLADYCFPAARPPKDPNPRVTRRLRRLLLDLTRGKADPSEFTPQVWESLLPNLKQATAFYQSLGPLRSFRLAEQTNAEGGRTLRYRVGWGGMTWIQTFALTEDGRIAGLGLQPG